MPIPNIYKIKTLWWFMKIEVTDINFGKEVLEKSKDTPVLVDF